MPPLVTLTGSWVTDPFPHPRLHDFGGCTPRQAMKRLIQGHSCRLLTLCALADRREMMPTQKMDHEDLESCADIPPC